MMNDNEIKSEIHPGLKKLGIGFVAEKTPYGVEEAKWKVLQSILLTMVMSGVIRIEVVETKDETIVSGYTFVESNLPEIPSDDLHRIDNKAIAEAVKKYPFLEAILKARFTPKSDML